MSNATESENIERIVLMLKSGQNFHFEGYQGHVDSISYIAKEDHFQWTSFSFHDPVTVSNQYSETAFRDLLPTTGLISILLKWVEENTK